jgi:hypothetical protein
MTIKQNTPVAAAMGVFAFWARATLPSISADASFALNPSVESMGRGAKRRVHQVLPPNRRG